MTKTELKRVVIKPYDKDRFELVNDYEFELPCFKGKIEKGFITDGASIPRIFWSLFPPFKSEYFSACVIHDFLCERAISRKDYKIADLALKEAMQVLGCSKFKIFVFYHSCNLYHALKCIFKSIKRS
ncbi:TPA: DUF1353 domain-containing protein [Campylobacter jejuni]|nr:DUF1353 domain-containing protein [Campylobacter jejuni]HDV7513963.1 DUF1353 domain-containing protein [Campylobacter jejuni]HDV7521492.1 DUF1353 domain-containing protein [Campylobacter jejuni]HED5389956.1 DUF1353 domain-containing protein [Campylobacter jejuni]HED5393445.1 DUF1353 domain-containing protein [Campylobacter jejuni]